MGLVLAFLLALNAYGQVAKSSTPGSDAWTLTWSDEFEGVNGSALDPAKWTLETGGQHGWGNNELEYYTSRPQNVQVQNGNLVITAVQEKYTGPDGVTRIYTSTRMNTSGKFSTYGRFEARIKIPYGQGIWPAFWMLGNDMKEVDWPSCGEIDIMENIGKEPAMVHGTIHGSGFPGDKGIGDPFFPYRVAGLRMITTYLPWSGNRE